MPRRLLVNADDFGLTPGVNRAVVELHQAGALRSATLMAGGSAFQEAVLFARHNPSLGVGCHVVFTDGQPVLQSNLIPSLVIKSQQQFRPSLIRFVFATLIGRVSVAEIANEAEAQIQRLQEAGLHVTHVDTHKHTHILPRVARGLLIAMERTGVRAIRNPFEPAWSVPLGPARRTRRLQLWLAGHLRRHFHRLPQIADGRVLTTDGTLGVSATGHLNEAVLCALLHAMPEGTWELVCHPGYNDRDLDRVTTRLRDEREVERLALQRVLGQSGKARDGSDATRAAFELIQFGDLQSPS